MLRAATTLTLLLSACAGAPGNPPAARENALFFEDFSHGLDDWWVEGGQRVWLADGRLHVRADPDRDQGEEGFAVATVWCRQSFPSDILIEFDAHVISSSLDVNNINFFLAYSDPSGRPLSASRDARAGARYGAYHGLNGHIVTFLRAGDHTYPDGSAMGRIRIRHNPGFELLGETYAHHCEQGRTYHVAITKRGSTLSVAVDGITYCTVTDPDMQGAGLIGCRTFRSYLWWDNIRGTDLSPDRRNAG